MHGLSCRTCTAFNCCRGTISATQPNPLSSRSKAKSNILFISLLNAAEWRVVGSRYTECVKHCVTESQRVSWAAEIYELEPFLCSVGQTQERAERGCSFSRADIHYLLILHPCSPTQLRTVINITTTRNKQRNIAEENSVPVQLEWVNKQRLSKKTDKIDGCTNSSIW